MCRPCCKFTIFLFVYILKDYVDFTRKNTLKEKIVYFTGMCMNRVTLLPSFPTPPSAPGPSAVYTGIYSTIDRHFKGMGQNGLETQK